MNQCYPLPRPQRCGEILQLVRRFSGLNLHFFQLLRRRKGPLATNCSTIWLATLSSRDITQQGLGGGVQLYPYVVHAAFHHRI